MSRKFRNKNIKCFLEQPLAENIFQSIQDSKIKRKKFELDRIGITKKKSKKRGVGVISTLTNQSSTVLQNECKETRGSNFSKGAGVPKTVGLSFGAETHSCVNQSSTNQRSCWSQFAKLQSYEPLSVFSFHECHDRFAASYKKRFSKNNLSMQPPGQTSSKVNRYGMLGSMSKKNRIEKAEEQIVRQFLKKSLHAQRLSDQLLGEGTNHKNNQTSKGLPLLYSNKTNIDEKAILSTRVYSEEEISMLRSASSSFSYNILMSIEQIRNILVSKRIQSYTFSEYKNQLREIKKIRFLYGEISKRELKKALLKAKQLYGIPGENLVVLLESRLDVVLHRCGFFSTIKASRQSIKHRRIKINSKVTDLPGYLLKPGDFIKIVPSKPNLVLKSKQLKNPLVLPKKLPENKILNAYKSTSSFSSLQDLFLKWNFAVFPTILKSLVQVQSIALRTNNQAESAATHLFKFVNRCNQTNFASKVCVEMSHAKRESNSCKNNEEAAPKVNLSATYSNSPPFLAATALNGTDGSRPCWSTKVKNSLIEKLVQNCGLILKPLGWYDLKQLQKVKQANKSKVSQATDSRKPIAVSLFEQIQITLDNKRAKHKWMSNMGSLCEPLKPAHKRWKKADCVNLFTNLNCSTGGIEQLIKKKEKREAVGQADGLRKRCTVKLFFNQAEQHKIWNMLNFSRFELSMLTSQPVLLVKHLQQMKRLAKLRKDSPFVSLKEERSMLGHTKRDKKVSIRFASMIYRLTLFKISLARSTRIIQALNFKPQRTPLMGFNLWKDCDFGDTTWKLSRDSSQYKSYIFSPLIEANAALKYKIYCFFLLIKKKLFYSISHADYSLGFSTQTSVAGITNESSFVDDMHAPTKKRRGDSGKSSNPFLQRSISRKAKESVGFADKTSINYNAHTYFSVKKTKPLHLEISYKNLCAIFLYPPQRVFLPAIVDINLLIKAIG